MGKQCRNYKFAAFVDMRLTQVAKVVKLYTDITT